MTSVVEVEVDDIKSYFTSLSDLPRADLVDMFINYNPLSEELPQFSSFYEQGTYFFVIKFGPKFTKTDLNYDAMRPWNKTIGTKKVKTKTEKTVINNEAVDVCRAYHPTLDGVKRLTIASATKVAIAYSFSAPVDFSLMNFCGARTKPSAIETIKDVIQYRSARNARKLLAANNLHVSENVVRNARIKVETSVKANTGPVKVTSLDKLAAVIRPHNSRLFIDNTDNNAIICTIVYEDALKVYVDDCPTLHELEEFHKYMERAIESNSVPAPDLYNNSTFLPGMEAQLSLDTTFDLSHLYVTLVFGKLAAYKSKKSLKDRPILLAAMVHSNKNSKAHSFFGDHFAATWKKISRGKCVPSIIKDGEIALDRVTADKVFGNATRLHCDLHLCDNILGYHSINSEEANILFGKLENGKIRNGLFQQATREEFDAYMDKIEKKYPVIYRKLSAKSGDSLFRYHSRRSKLMSGYGGRYATNNVTECLNNVVKKYITKKVPGEEVMQQLLFMHLKEMNKICEGSNSSLVELVESSPFWWMSKDYKKSLKKNSADKSSADCTGELDSPLADLLFIPIGVLATVSGDEKILLKTEQQLLAVTNGPEGDYIITKKNSDEMARVRLDGKRMKCNIPSCRSNKRYLTLPCPHVLCVLRSKKECYSYWKYYEEKACTQSFQDIERAALKKGDGSKRKGKITSKSNYKRLCLEPLSADAIDSTLESLHFSPPTTPNLQSTASVDYTRDDEELPVYTVLRNVKTMDTTEDGDFDYNSPLSSYVRHPTLTHSYEIDDESYNRSFTP